MPKGQRRWSGDRLEALHTSYMDRDNTLKQVALDHTTTIGNIARLRKKHGWASRRPSNKDPRVPIMRQRRDYVKRRISEFSKELEQLNAKLRFLESLSA